MLLQTNLKTFNFSLRILPHKQNTGGFFVAVLRKSSAPVKQSAVTDNKTESAAENINESKPSPKDNSPPQAEEDGKKRKEREDDNRLVFVICS